MGGENDDGEEDELERVPGSLIGTYGSTSKGQGVLRDHANEGDDNNVPLSLVKKQSIRNADTTELTSTPLTQAEAKTVLEEIEQFIEKEVLPKLFASGLKREDLDIEFKNNAYTLKIKNTDELLYSAKLDPASVPASHTIGNPSAPSTPLMQSVASTIHTPTLLGPDFIRFMLSKADKFDVSFKSLEGAKKFMELCGSEVVKLNLDGIDFTVPPLQGCKEAIMSKRDEVLERNKPAVTINPHSKL